MIKIQFSQSIII